MTAASLAFQPAAADALATDRGCAAGVRAAPVAAARAAGAAVCKVDTPLGAALLLATPRGLAGLWFDGQAHHPGELAMAAPPGADASRHLDDTRTQLAAWWRAERTRFTLALDPQGTPFQLAVWRALLEIPYGGRTEYGRLAAALGLAPGAARAVGGAVGRNPLSVIVPCHRVVGRDGSLTGYAGGLERKRWLLAHEARVGGRA